MLSIILRGEKKRHLYIYRTLRKCIPTREKGRRSHPVKLSSLKHIFFSIKWISVCVLFFLFSSSFSIFFKKIQPAFFFFFCRRGVQSSSSSQLTVCLFVKRSKQQTHRRGWIWGEGAWSPPLPPPPPPPPPTQKQQNGQSSSVTPPS